jgi:uncharacterized membrane protein
MSLIVQRLGDGTIGQAPEVGAYVCFARDHAHTAECLAIASRRVASVGTRSTSVEVTMVTARNVPNGVRRPRPKYLLFGFVGLMVLVVGYKDRVLLDAQSPIWDHYSSFEWWLLPHGIAGALALFLGPVQFSTSLRQRLLRWHRRIGRVYVGAVAVAAPLGAWIEYVKYRNGIGSLRLAVGSGGLGTLFFLTTGIGFLMVKRRNIQAHRRWMTRSYAVALIFLETRCVDQSPWLAKLLDWPSTMLETHHIADLWMYMAVAIVAAQLVLWTEDLLKRRARVKTAALVGAT